MGVFKSKIDINSEKYNLNYNYQKKLANELDLLIKKIKKMGSELNVQKHKENGKITVRERIDKLIDKNTNFIEFSTLAGFQIYKDEIPAGGIITGIGIVEGHFCIIQNGGIETHIDMAKPFKVDVVLKIENSHLFEPWNIHNSTSPPFLRDKTSNS